MDLGTGEVVVDVVKDYLIKLVRSNSTFWWRDIKMSLNNKNVIVIDVKLDVSTNYEMVQMIDSYHSYVLYHDNLVKAIYNKPLSIASLNIVNDDNILDTIDKLEKDLLLYRKQIIELEKKIVDRIKYFITTDRVVLQEDDFSYRINRLFNIFKFSKYVNPLEQSLNITYEQVKLKKD